jgi:hypothetical protein
MKQICISTANSDSVINDGIEVFLLLRLSREIYYLDMDFI